MLQVKRSNESAWQLITDSYGYVWKFRKTDLTNYDGNNQYDYFHIPWHGHTSGSTFYGGGNYDLKITVIDQGANYSEQIFSFNATTYGGSLPALAPPEPYLQSYGNYVGLGSAGSYYSGTITIQNLGLQTLYSAVNYNYRNYDCYSNNPDAPLLPSNYLLVYGCPYNMYTVNSQSSVLVSCWQYRPNLYIPPGEYFRTFYQYAEISGKRLENNVTDLVSVWGYVGNPYPSDECGNDEPEGAATINPEVELFNKNLRSTTDGVLNNNLKKQVFDNYKRIIERYPDSSIAVHALNGIIQLSGINSDSVTGFLNYIDDLSNRFSNKKISFYSQYIRSHFETDGEKKLQILNKVFTKNKSSVLGLLALTDKFYHFFRTRQDSLARNAAEEIKKHFSDSPIVYEVFDVLTGNANEKKEISESFHKLKDQSKTVISQNNDSTLFLTNYPNPFNPSTTISFAIPEISEAELGIYNSVGQKVKTLYTGNQRRGTLSVVWDGKNDNGNSVASGMYFVILQYQQTSLVRKIILLK